MKLLRVGEKGKEKPAILDANGKIRDISSHVSDLNPHNLNFETISKIQKFNFIDFNIQDYFIMIIFKIPTKMESNY